MCVIFCAEVPAAPLAPTGRAVGIDVGIANLVATSDGEFVPKPAPWPGVGRRSGSPAGNEPATFAQAGGARTGGDEALVRHRGAAQLRGEHHPAGPGRSPTRCLAIARQACKDLIGQFKNLTIAIMMRSTAWSAWPSRGPGPRDRPPRPASTVPSPTPGGVTLLRFISYKAESAGRDAPVCVPPAPPSCARPAGERRGARRADQGRVFRCQACGYTTHADTNAAVNIYRAGLCEQVTRYQTVGMRRAGRYLGVPAWLGSTTDSSSTTPSRCSARCSEPGVVMRTSR